MGTSAEVLIATGTFQPSRNERQERLNDFSKDTWREAVPEITSPLRPWLMFCSLICCPLVTNAAWGCRRMDVLHGVGLHMYSCNENALNLIQNKLHFSTCLQRYRVLLVKITLVSMGDCEHALSLTSSSLLPAPSGIFFWGGLCFSKAWLEFYWHLHAIRCMRDVLPLTLGCFSYVTGTCCALFAGLGAPHSTWPVWCSLLLIRTE